MAAIEYFVILTGLVVVTNFVIKLAFGFDPLWVQLTSGAAIFGVFLLWQWWLLSRRRPELDQAEEPAAEPVG